MRAAMALSSLQKADLPLSAAPADTVAPHPQVWRGDEVVASAGALALVPSGFAPLDAELPGGGWPCGQLIEMLIEREGVGELSLLAPALVRATREQRPCVWVLPGSASGPATVTQEALPYAPALQAAGVNLARHIFVKPASTREAFWAVEQSLRSAHLGVLIAWLPASGSADTEFRTLRRLHLLASRTRTLVFVLRSADCVNAPSPAALRLQLAASDGLLQVRLLKRRGRPLLEPIHVQVHPAHWSSARVALASGGQGTTDQVAAKPSAQHWLRTLFTH